MKNLIALATLIFLMAFPVDQTMAQSNTLMISSDIKPENKDRYENWIKDIFFASLMKSENVQMQDQYSRMMWLQPEKANTDGTWTYSFVISPAKDGDDYNFPTLLKEFYNPSEVKKLMEDIQNVAGPPAFARYNAMSQATADEAAIIRTIEMETKAYNARDIDAWAQQSVQDDSYTVTYAADPGAPNSMQGFSNVHKVMKDYFATAPKEKSSVERSKWHFNVLGDVATVNFMAKNISESNTFTSHEMRVMKKVNGHWKINHVTAAFDMKNAKNPVRSDY